MNFEQVKNLKWSEILQCGIVKSNIKNQNLGSAYITDNEEYLFLLKISEDTFSISIYSFNDDGIAPENPMFTINKKSLTEILNISNLILKFEPYIIMNDYYTG